MILDLRKHTGEDLEAQILFVAQPVGAPLDDPDFIVQAFDEPQGDFVLRVTICRNPVPMALNQFREFLVRLQPLPLQGSAPVRKEAPCPAFLLVGPQLAERLLEQVGGLHPLVGAEQDLERAAAFEGQMLAPRQQRILLPLDELTVGPAQAGVLAFPHLVQGLVEVAQDMELVEQNLGLRGMGRLERRGAKGLPHIHHRQANVLALRGSQPGVEHIHALLRPISSPEPEHPPPRQVADDNAVGIPLADGNLVDADEQGPRGACPAPLLLHVLLVQLLDRLPVQVQLPGDIAQGGCATPPPDQEGEAFGIEGIGSQPGYALLLYGSTVLTPHTPALDLQIDPRVAAGEVAHPPHLAVVERPRRRAAEAATSFFLCRTSRTMRALGSPKTPRTVALGLKPGKRYVSTSRRGGRIGKACHVFSWGKTPLLLVQSRFPAPQLNFFTHSIGRRPIFRFYLVRVKASPESLSGGWSNAEARPAKHESHAATPRRSTPDSRPPSRETEEWIGVESAAPLPLSCPVDRHRG